MRGLGSQDQGRMRLVSGPRERVESVVWDGEGELTPPICSHNALCLCETMFCLEHI